MYRVFVSSTWLDLQPERKALMEALNRMEEMRFVGMEFFGNRPDDTHDASIDQVDLCEVFVGIIGHRYGSGITEAEYRRARALNLPCFVYFKRGTATSPEQTDNDPALAAKLEAFKQDLLRGHTVKEFERPEELSANATADLHNWVAARWISVEREQAAAARPRSVAVDADRTNSLRLIERVDQDWVKGVLEASLHHRAWLELGLDWRDDAVEHPWDRIVVAPNRPIQTLSKQDSITGIFDAAQHTLLVLGEPGAGKTTTVLELARDLVARARESAAEPVPAVLALSNWRGQHKDLTAWLVAELGLRYQVPKKVARTWLEEGRLVLILDGLDEVIAERRVACVEAINAFEEAHPPSGLAVTCRVAEYEALTTKLRLRSAICLQPLTPEQIERYFKAAGAGLDPLRAALRGDVGLRELARSPLMLSVMTMAWRDAPAGTTAPFAANRTPEELRRGLFDAYVQAALKRRGKATGQFAPEQTITWLTWLAQRMKEHGHTLFALEQLQPGWLDGAWRQFGYFLTSRLLGSVGVALPFFFTQESNNAKLALAGLSLAAGSYMGVIDFAITRHGWGGHWRAGLRFGVQLAGLLALLLSWVSLSPHEGMGMFYIFLLIVAFCAPVDVRALDIKPAGSIQWSKPRAALYGLYCLEAITVILTAVLLARVGIAASAGTWAQGWILAGGWFYLGGLALGGAAVTAVWRWKGLTATPGNLVQAVSLVLFGGQIGGSIGSVWTGDVSFWQWQALLPEFMPMALVGLFGGFGSTLIDPARPQQAGVWLWLRVPVMVFLTVGGVILAAGLLFLVPAALASDASPGQALAGVGAVALFATGCGLVGFLRSGGFNGAQHFLLRWQLARSGHLPPRPEAFLNHAAQLALLQRVGLGFRFVHALLLQHLAAPGAGLAARDPGGDTGRPNPAPGLKVAAGLGLLAGLGLFISMVVAGCALHGLGDTFQAWNMTPVFFGSFMVSIAVVIPVWLLSGRWLARLSWFRLAVAGAGLALVTGWLVRDETPMRPPLTVTALAPAFPGAEQSHAVLKRYYNTQPAGREFKWRGLNFVNNPMDEPVWREFLGKRRSEIEANWAALAPVRGWLDELNAFERIGDLDEDPLAWTTLNFMVPRAYTQNAMAVAGLRALDGQGDAALLGLLPLLEVGRKLEAGARGISNFEKSRDMQDCAIWAADFVFKNDAPVSGPVRVRFAAALANRAGPEGVRRAFAIRQAGVTEASGTLDQTDRFWRGTGVHFFLRAAEWLRPVVFNRQATLNRWDRLFADLEELAVKRDIAGIERRVAEFEAAGKQIAFKNIGGAWFGWLVEYRLGLKQSGVKVVESYWATEDRRAALLQRLQQPADATKSVAK
jgi:DNA polymerase III delta prime subunit